MRVDLMSYVDGIMRNEPCDYVRIVTDKGTFEIRTRPDGSLSVHTQSKIQIVPVVSNEIEVTEVKD